MALEDIKDKIYEDAQKKRDELINKANEKKKETLDEYNAKIKDFSESSITAATSKGENVKKGVIIDARLKLRNDILAKKRVLIDSVIDQAKKEFISSKEYADTIAAAVQRYTETKKEQIIFSSAEKILDKKWVEKLNKDLNADFTISDERGDFTGGIILKDGEVYINLTLDLLIYEMKSQCEKEIAGILF